MARLPVVTRDQVPEQFREAFDELTAESGGVITFVAIQDTELQHACARRGHPEGGRGLAA